MKRLFIVFFCLAGSLLVLNIMWVLIAYHSATNVPRNKYVKKELFMRILSKNDSLQKNISILGSVFEELSGSKNFVDSLLGDGQNKDSLIGLLKKSLGEGNTRTQYKYVYLKSPGGSIEKGEHGGSGKDTEDKANEEMVNEMKALIAAADENSGGGFSMEEKIVKFADNKVRDNMSNFTVKMYHVDRHGKIRIGAGYEPYVIHPGQKNNIFKSLPGDEFVKYELITPSGQAILSPNYPMEENQPPSFQRNWISPNPISASSVETKDITLFEILLSDPDTKIEQVDVLIGSDQQRLIKIQRDEKQPNRFYFILKKQEKDWAQKLLDSGVLKELGPTRVFDIRFSLTDNIPGRRPIQIRPERLKISD